MIPQGQIAELRALLEGSERPLFLFDDDPDGMTSFVQLYRFLGRGVGIIVKASPVLSEMYLRKVREHNPDAVFVLDKPQISHEFVRHCPVPIVWLDHHPPEDIPAGVRYFNPRVKDPEDGTPTSYWAYKVAGQHLWLAMTGVVGDWQLTELAGEFAKKEPELLPPELARPEDALYRSPLGEFARMLSFVVKGSVSEAMNCVKILTRIESPWEVLRQSTPRGRYLYRKQQRVRKEYDYLLAQAEKGLSEERLLTYLYTEQNTSFTSELSNELVYRHPDKIVLICRSRGDEMKCSLRAASLDVHGLVKESLAGLDGYGGGHEHACGACVKQHHWEAFLDRVKEMLK